jgi:hypothetical protein
MYLTQEQASGAARIMKRWAEGEKVQSCEWGTDDWQDVTNIPWWNWSAYNYRIKSDAPKWSINNNLLGYMIAPEGKNETHLIISQNKDGVVIAKGILVTYYDLDKQYHMLGKVR